jgi:hypothetical protein
MRRDCAAGLVFFHQLVRRHCDECKYHAKFAVAYERYGEFATSVVGVTLLAERHMCVAADMHTQPRMQAHGYPFTAYLSIFHNSNTKHSTA